MRAAATWAAEPVAKPGFLYFCPVLSGAMDFLRNLFYRNAMVASLNPLVKALLYLHTPDTNLAIKDL